MSVIPKQGEVYEYEFTEMHNQIISELARFMRITGILVLLFSAVQLIKGFATFARGGWIEAIAAALSVAIGIFTLKAASFFYRIVNSRGEDLAHLMEALGTLRSLYKLQAWAYLAIVILFGLALILVVFAAMVG